MERGDERSVVVQALESVQQEAELSERAGEGA